MTRYVRGVSIYKPKRRSRRTDPYLLSWTDGAGERRSRTGSTDLQITIRLANEIALRKDAAVMGLVDRHAERHAMAQNKRIAEHIADFREWLAAKGDTEGYAKESAKLVERVLDAAGITSIADLAPGDVQRAIKSMPRKRIGEGTLSNRSLDKAVRACKRFGSYLKKNNLVSAHPLLDLSHYDPEADRRRVRRTVEPEQVLTLIEAADAGVKLGGIDGADRAMMYRIATATGLRFGSIMSLRHESFVMNSPAPFLRVEARFVKNRKKREIPLRADLVAMLRPWLTGKRRGEPLFKMSTGAKFMDAFRTDLKAAGIPYQDESGHFFDFHAQRNQFITAVVRSAGLVVAQDLAGHSTPVLTAKYARMNFTDYSKALEGLPPLSQPKKKGDTSGGVA